MTSISPGKIRCNYISAWRLRAETTEIKQQQTHYLNIREIIRKASGETLDLKPYEADMRHLIDTYI